MATERVVQPTPAPSTSGMFSSNRPMQWFFCEYTVRAGALISRAIPQKRSADSVTDGRRQRILKVTRACDICKVRKIKCSGDQPCETCTRRGLRCLYEAVHTRGKAPAPRASDSLYSGPVSPEQRNSASGPSNLASLEPAMIRAQQRVSTPAYPHPILSGTHGLPSQGASSIGGAVVQGVGDVEPPSRASPGLEVAGQYSDTTSGLSFLHRAWRRISNKESSQVVNGQLGSTEDCQLLMSAGDKPFEEKEVGHLILPSLDTSKGFLNLYFDVCIATYRMLHRPTVEAWLLSVTDNAQQNKSLQNEIGRAKAAVVLSVLAIASFHEEKAKGDIGSTPENEHIAESQSDNLFVEAARLTHSETGIPQLESAQCRLVQVLYLLMSCRFNQAWYTFGHALQIISALGLHRRDDRKRHASAPKRDYINEQCRKRTFWVAYTLDKYLGVIFGRPRHYHDDDIDQTFPDVVNDEDMGSTGPRTTSAEDCHIESLVCHARLAQIAEQISREVYSIKPIPDHHRLASSHRLAASLREWKASLPPFLGAVNPSSLIPTFRRQATALKLSYCHAVMLAHRPFLLKNTLRNNDDMRNLAKDSLAECISAARSVLDAVDRMAREGPMFHAFWWTHYVCFCALVVVYVWAIQETSRASTSAEDRRNILDQAERCLQHLAQATASNSPSRRYSIILQELRAEAKRKTAIPAEDKTPTLSTTNMPGDSISFNEPATSDINPPDTTLQMSARFPGSLAND
ncbi:fungal specific transcription factor domain-containing protein [Stemphylium lycopersici]|uniref:Fungal specific transcription factor domain-containing protein n=1 Tax=Stemphylium lycopersici TaxID=183478 RepID=A0A364N4P2_STELY|nr:fungal specific transcription factor domain-containing protein [Stemphylium lycopersici]